MRKQLTLTQEDFDVLLGWLSDDREEAGRQYELIREGLNRFFRFRGCADPTTLADETINRVAQKISTFDASKNVKTITYFYGFASKIFLEYLRTTKNREVSLESEEFARAKTVRASENSVDAESVCLENCLGKLPPEDGALIVEYYGKDKSEKFEMRRKLAAALNLKMPALHTKVFRLRHALRECVEKCVAVNRL